MQQIERRESSNLTRPHLAIPSVTDSEGFKLPAAQVKMRFKNLKQKFSAYHLKDLLKINSYHSRAGMHNSDFTAAQSNVAELLSDRIC